MGDWLHCNSCYRQPGSGRNYFLTNCGHIYCENCQDKGWKERCLLCGTGHPSSFKLTSKLPPPVDAYFSDPIKMLKQTASEMKQILAATEFQHHQRKRFMTHLQKNVSNQKAIVEKCEKELKEKTLTVFAQLEKEKTKYQNESRQLKEENKYLKVLLSEKVMVLHPFGAIQEYAWIHYNDIRPDLCENTAYRGKDGCDS
ncbi:RN212-like protein [Mya arenaria]|uniref:RN212-like protein n=1 Tax=Mya arenaria TaxID=6604 RepID=A0ABY7FQM4_MYAAR|nr:RN212-like protein [Mya arenaria]